MRSPVFFTALVALVCALRLSGSENMNFQSLMDGYKESYKRSLKWYEKAALQGYAEAQYNLGIQHYLGLGTNQNPAQARIYLQKAASQGYQQAQSLLGILLHKGEGGEKNQEEAILWLQKASKAGSSTASLVLAMIRSDQLINQEVLELYERAARDGSAEGAYLLGSYLINGPKALKDSARGARWIFQAAEKNHPQAQFSAGILALGGIGTERNQTEALRWFLLASKSNNPESQFQAGYLYETGTDSEKSKAARWYRKAAIQGHQEAQARLGYLYMIGKGTQPDGHDAFKWSRRAAEQGHPQAQYNLSHLLFRGIGTDRDLVKSLAWMMLADQQKLKEATRALPYLRQQLTPSEVDQAKKLFTLGPLRIFGKSQLQAALPQASQPKLSTPAKPEPKAAPKEKSLEEKAEEGDAQSQFELGMKKGGAGSAEGKQWLEKAAASKHKNALATLLKREHQEADQLYQAAKNKETIALLEKALKRDENNFQTLLRLTKAHNSLGLDLDSEGKSAEYEKEILKTIELAESMKKIDPNRGEPYLYLAIGNGNLAKLKGGKDKVKIGSKVESFCKEAIKRDNSLGMAHAVLATYYINVASLPWLLKAFAKTFLGKLPDVTQEDALKLYDEAIKADPELIYAFNKLGLVNKHLDKKEEARRWFQKTLDLKPRNSQDRRTQAEAAKSLKDL